MIAVGEKTGTLEAMLEKISMLYKEEVDGAVGALISIIEPVMIVILSVVIGGILISLYLPIFNMMGIIK
jgi:type IV pilus assembly protein PilC